MKIKIVSLFLILLSLIWASDVLAAEVSDVISGDSSPGSNGVLDRIDFDENVIVIEDEIYTLLNSTRYFSEDGRKVDRYMFVDGMMVGYTAQDEQILGLWIVDQSEFEDVVENNIEPKPHPVNPSSGKNGGTGMTKKNGVWTN